jgi:uncharacterized membrane-anchored protein
MIRLKNLVDRIPRVVLFATAGLVQVALIALLVLDRVQILRTGREVTLQTIPVDPRDFLRGDYVVLRYDVSALPDGTLDRATRGMPVFVKLVADNDGVHKLSSVHKQRVPVGDNEILLRGRVRDGISCLDTDSAFCRAMTVNYGIEQYFVPQGEGRAIEQARNQGKVSIVAAVTPDGRAAVKRLLLDGKPVYDEPLF